MKKIAFRGLAVQCSICGAVLSQLGRTWDQTGFEVGRWNGTAIAVPITHPWICRGGAMCRPCCEAAAASVRIQDQEEQP